MTVLVVGAGGMGRRHVDALIGTGRCEVACFDAEPARVELLRVSHPSVCPVGSLDVHHRWDGVVIATPTDTHVALATWCATQGFPFLVEKPIAVDERDLDALLDMVRRSGVAAGVAYPRRHAPAIRQMQAMVAAGAIGELKMVHSVFSQDFRKYRPDYRQTYYAKLSSGGGALMDALSHHLDLVTYFAGEAASVCALSGRLVVDGCEGEDAAMVLLQFRNGILGSVHGNQFQKPNVDAIELVGAKGNLKYERLTGVLSAGTSDSPWQESHVDGNWDRVIAAQASCLVDVLEGKGEFPTSLSSAWHTLKIVLAARRAQTEHAAVAV